MSPDKSDPDLEIALENRERFFREKPKTLILKTPNRSTLPRREANWRAPLFWKCGHTRVAGNIYQEE
jgi:hypothetical protein